jgi:hypothetical protein
VTIAPPDGTAATPAANLAIRPRRGRVALVVLAIALNVALVLVIAWLVTHRDRVADQFTVWNYTAPATIAEYATRAGLTDEGRFLLYASTPSISTGQAFDAACSTRQEGVGILGCYLPATRHVHLFDVADARLDGLEEVVASHEMLHAAWDRMSEAERDALEPLLDAEAAKRTDDKDLTDKLAFYASTEPGERLNELHSILGTEYGSLSPELEKHYSLFFSDRTVVVGLHEKSSAVFVEQQGQITKLNAQINALAAGIDADYLAYNSGYDALSTDVAAFNARAQAGDFSSESAFESERNALISRQSGLDALYQSISDRHAQYDDLVAQLTNLNAQVDELNRSINIIPRTAPSL